MNDFEIFRKPADKSSVICFSPQYLNSLIPRRSVSPKRYCLGTDNLESYKSSNLSNRSSRSSYCQNYLSGIRSSDNIKKFRLNTLSENTRKNLKKIGHYDSLIGKKKQTPKALKKITDIIANHKRENKETQKKLKYNITEKIKDFKKKMNKAIFDEKQDLNTKIDENTLSKNFHNKSPSTNTNRLPLAPKVACPKPPKPRTTSSESRKLPARYLRVSTAENSTTKEAKVKSHIEVDLKLIQENNSENLLKGLEAAKFTRLHHENMKKNSILKNVNEESWD